MLIMMYGISDSLINYWVNAVKCSIYSVDQSACIVTKCYEHLYSQFSNGDFENCSHVKAIFMANISFGFIILKNLTEIFWGYFLAGSKFPKISNFVLRKQTQLHRWFRLVRNWKIWLIPINLEDIKSRAILSLWEKMRFF